MTSRTLTDDCKDALDDLSKSPSFAMSRGSKELFHTNFIAFILDMDPGSMQGEDQEVIRTTRSRLLRVLFGDPAPGKVLAWREKSSLDLVVVAAPTEEDTAPGAVEASDRTDKPKLGFAGLSGRGELKRGGVRTKGPDVGVFAVIVEAKLKALPSFDQLKDYDQKLSKGLSLDLADPITVEYPPRKGANSESFWWGRIDIKGLPVSAESLGSGQARVFAYHTPVRVESATNNEPDGREQSAQRNACFATARGTVRRLLLTPDDPAKMAQQIAEGSGWNFLPWERLLEAFPGGTAKPHEGLMTRLLRDYAESTSQLLRVVSRTSAWTTAFIEGAEGAQSLGELHAGVAGRDAQRFKTLRIHDVVGKRAYSLLEAKLRDAVAKEVGEAPSADFNLSTYTFLSNATPGLVIEFKRKSKEKGGRRTAERNVCIGVQIQGTDYRHFVSASHPSERRNSHALRSAAHSLGAVGTNEQGSWWQIDDRTPRCVQTIANAKGEFFKFNSEAFLYCKADVSSLDFAALSQLVIASMARAKAILTHNTEFLEKASDLIRTSESVTGPKSTPEGP